MKLKPFNGIQRLSLLTLVLGLLTACGAPRPLMNYPMPRQMNPYAAQRYQPPTRMQAYNQSFANVRGSLSPSRPKDESKLVDRNVTVPRSAFDAYGDRAVGRVFSPDPVYKQSSSRGPAQPGLQPFVTFIDFKDHVRYGYGTAFEDFKYMDESTARSHFSRYIDGAYREVQQLYKASREDMKRFITLDTLVNSLSVDGRALAYQDLHNPPPRSQDKLLPPAAAKLMPSFGEIVAYNRSSFEVNYVRWDLSRAAQYYQRNYARIFGLIMEYGPAKQDAWRLVHREISAAAAY